jgi:hypothetical protein
MLTSLFLQPGKFSRPFFLSLFLMTLRLSYGNPRTRFAEILGEEIGAKLKPVWGVDEEGEVNSLWRDTGVPRLYYTMGTCPNLRCENKETSF